MVEGDRGSSISEVGKSRGEVVEGVRHAVTYAQGGERGREVVHVAVEVISQVEGGEGEG